MHCPQRCFHSDILVSKIISLILPSARLIIRGISLLIVSICCLFVFHPDVHSCDMLKETKWVFFWHLILAKGAIYTPAVHSDPALRLRACGWLPLPSAVEMTQLSVWAERLKQPRQKQHATTTEQCRRNASKPNKRKKRSKYLIFWLSLPSFLDSGYSWAHMCTLEISEVTLFQMWTVLGSFFCPGFIAFGSIQ